VHPRAIFVFVFGDGTRFNGGVREEPREKEDMKGSREVGGKGFLSDGDRGVRCEAVTASERISSEQDMRNTSYLRIMQELGGDNEAGDIGRGRICEP
jgi:hypothetical protein